MAGWGWGWGQHRINGALSGRDTNSNFLVLILGATCPPLFSWRRPVKSLERIFPCGLDMALIVDDRDDVWRGEQSKNLLLVRPYKFFMVS